VVAAQRVALSRALSRVLRAGANYGHITLSLRREFSQHPLGHKRRPAPALCFHACALSQPSISPLHRTRRHRPLRSAAVHSGGGGGSGGGASQQGWQDCAARLSAAARVESVVRAITPIAAEERVDVREHLQVIVTQITSICLRTLHTRSILLVYFFCGYSGSMGVGMCWRRRRGRSLLCKRSRLPPRRSALTCASTC
jgi:hypothetical protein